MAAISLRQLLDHAAEHGYGVPAFNINNMEQALAIMEATLGPEHPRTAAVAKNLAVLAAEQGAGGRKSPQH